MREITSPLRALLGQSARKPNGTRRPGASRCPVEQLSKLSELLLVALDGLGKQQNAARMEWQQAELEDRHRAIANEASFLVARSATGAQFQAMIASSALQRLTEVSETDRLKSETDHHELERHVQRCLYSVVRFLDSIGAEHRERIREFYAPPWDDAHVLFDAVIKK